MPSAAELRKSGVKVSCKGKEKATDPLREALELFASAGQEKEGTEKEEASLPLVQMGCGLPALPRKLLEKIEAGEYIDFIELPPAKGKSKSISQAFDG